MSIDPEQVRLGFLEALEDPSHPVWDIMIADLVRIWSKHPPLSNGHPDPDHCTACRKAYEMQTKERCQALTVGNVQCQWRVRHNKDGHGVCNIHMLQKRTKYYIPPPAPPYEIAWDRWRQEARQRMEQRREAS